MLLLWLFATTDPEYMRGKSPEGALDFSYEKVASALGFSVDYVKFFFKWAHQKGRAEKLNQVQLLFEDLIGTGSYVPGNGGGSCVHCDLVLKFAATARAVWKKPIKIPTKKTK